MLEEEDEEGDGDDDDDDDDDETAATAPTPSSLLIAAAASAIMLRLFWLPPDMSDMVKNVEPCCRLPRDCQRVVVCSLTLVSFMATDKIRSWSWLARGSRAHPSSSFEIKISAAWMYLHYLPRFLNS